MTILIVFVGTWFIFGVLHAVLCLKDEHAMMQRFGQRPHAWVFVLLTIPPMVLFGPIGLIIRDWSHRTFPHWYEE